MAKQLSFPRYIDRPRLFLMFEIDEVLWSLGVATVVAAFTFLSTMKPAVLIFTYILVVPLVFAIVKENKRRTELAGSVEYMLYAAGIVSNKPMSIEKMKVKWPELSRMDDCDFVPYGFEDEFYS